MVSDTVQYFYARNFAVDEDERLEGYYKVYEDDTYQSVIRWHPHRPWIYTGKMYTEFSKIYNNTKNVTMPANINIWNEALLLKGTHNNPIKM